MFNRLPEGRLNYEIMASLGTIFFGQTSEYNGKRVCDMTDEEKAALVVRYKAKGTTCIIDGYNNKEYEDGTHMLNAGLQLDSKLYPEVTFENSPMEVELKLIEK